MKKLRKTTALLLTLALMMSALAACGGKKAESLSLDNDGVNAEPNTGVQGIVYAVPEGWKQTSVEIGEFSVFSKDDSEYSLNVYSTNQEQLASYDDEEISKMKIGDYYKKYYTPRQEKNIEAYTVKICDTDANYEKRVTDKGCTEAITYWMYDDVIYSFYLVSNDAEIEDEEDENASQDTAPMSDELLAEYEYVLASIKPGDGSSLQNDEVTVDSLGELSFDTPKGFTGVLSDANFADFEKADGGAIIELSRVSENDLEDLTTAEGETPKSVKEYYESNRGEDTESIQIAGRDGYIRLSKEEDGKIYYGVASFMTDSSAYEIRIDSGDDSIWDDNGNLKKDAVSLTDDEIKAFEDFLKTIKLK